MCCSVINCTRFDSRQKRSMVTNRLVRRHEIRGALHLPGPGRRVLQHAVQLIRRAANVFVLVLPARDSAARIAQRWAF